MNHHVRLHTSILANSEKRLLIRIANRLPRWINSDHLTLLALVAMALAGAGFGDSLDGTLARVRRVERPRYGFYVDHVLDIVGITLLLGGLACSGFMHPVIALFRDPHVDLGALGTVRMFDVGELVATAGMGAALAVAVTRNTATLARLEPRRRDTMHQGCMSST